MSGGAVRIAIVGEDEVHAALGRSLADAAIERRARSRGADWFEVEHHRRWDLPPTGGRHWEIKDTDSGMRRFRLSGYIDGQPLHPSAAMFRKHLVRHLERPDPPDLLVILQDTDGDEARFRGAQQVTAGATQNPHVVLVIGVPHRDAEGWLLAGHPPEPRLLEATATLSFNPATAPERLTSRPNDTVTNAKRVLRFVALGEGESLSPHSPPSRPPSPDEAEILARRLSERANPGDQHLSGCKLGAFLSELDGAIEKVFSTHLP